MKKGLLLSTTAVLAASTAHAAIVLSDDFNAYSDGNLSTQGGWTATASAATPMQVSGGAVMIGTAGQDEYKAFSQQVPTTAGTSIFSGFDITLSAAQTNGDYFFNLSDPVGTASNFYGRVFAKSNGAGNFLVGFASGSGTGSVTTYGATNLSIGQTYRVVLAWNFVAGTLNDTFNLYVSPTDTSVEGNNTPYIANYTWTGSTAEPAANVSAGNLRQGSASNAPSVTLDNLAVATTFTEAAAPVPEPTTLVSLAGGVGMLMGFRRLRGARNRLNSSPAPHHPTVVR